MVCLTGDVHQRSYRGTDTPYSRQTEVELARKYAAIAEKYNIKLSLFFTGRACHEEPELVRAVANQPHCEIGGHTFAAFRDPLSRFFKMWYGNPWGTAAHQLRDIHRTIEAVQQVTGQRIHTWRNHSYIRTPETDRLLESCGICVVSDEVSNSKMTVEWRTSGFRSVPLNVLPDHEHVLHGKYHFGTSRQDRLASRMTIEEWGALVKTRIHAICDQGGTATILAHPLCMEVADGMIIFEDLCRHLQQYQTVWISELT